MINQRFRTQRSYSGDEQPTDRAVHLTFWLNTLAPQITTTQKASKMPTAMISSMSSSLFAFLKRWRAFRDEIPSRHFHSITSLVRMSPNWCWSFWRPHQKQAAHPWWAKCQAEFDRHRAAGAGGRERGRDLWAMCSTRLGNHFHCAPVLCTTARGRSHATF